MRIIRIKAGESVEDLVSRAYSGLDTKTAVREAATALRAVNPGLRRRAHVAEGARIVLPDLPGARPAGRARSATDESAEALVRGMRRAADAAGDDLLAAAAEAAALAEEQVRLLDRVDMGDVGRLGEIAEAVDRVREDAELARREVEAIQASVESTRSLIARDDERLAELVKGTIGG